MSANGTWINQHTKLVRGHRRLLHSGDEIALLNPYKHHKKHPSGVADGQAEGAGGESGKEGDDVEKLEAEAATFTFINLNRSVLPKSARRMLFSWARLVELGILSLDLDEKTTVVECFNIWL